MTTRRALDRLYDLAPRGAELGLARMAEACARFGHPERVARVVHVAGTNGKGSTAAMVAAALRAAGLRVGLYTSPHLCKVSERVRIGGVPVDDAELERVLGAVLDRAPGLTFFEAITLAALVAFADANVEAAVLEVGLGGRLDATNVVERPTVTVVTRIALDHQDRLGETLAAIASEKAGIVKPGVPVVTGDLPPEAFDVVARVASKAGAPLVRALDDARAGALVARSTLALDGPHQAQNARVAAVAAALAGAHDAAIEAGLREVSWPGRLETLRVSSGRYLVDAAHNPDGAMALARAIAASDARPAAIVFGAMADKDVAGMLAALAPLPPVRIFVEPGGRRAADAARLASEHGGRVAADVAAALAEARARVGPDALVLVAGSIFLVGEARAILLGLERDPPVAL